MAAGYPQMQGIFDRVLYPSFISGVWQDTGTGTPTWQQEIRLSKKWDVGVWQICSRARNFPSLEKANVQFLIIPITGREQKSKWKMASILIILKSKL